MTTATLENLEREDLDRVERVLQLRPESPRLQSLTEAHAERICPGFLNQGCVNGGDEAEEESDLCAADIREEERFYQRETWAADGLEEFTGYPHLTDREVA